MTSGSAPAPSCADLPVSGEPSGDLLGQAKSFAAALRMMLEGSVTHSADIQVEDIVGAPSGEALRVEPPHREQCVPLATAQEREVGLFLKLSFTVRLDDEGLYMAVESSQFGLCIDEKTGRCAIRIEYERAKERKRPAHLHIDGHSDAFGFAYGRLNRKVKPLQTMHMPLGHRRYRPSLEEFILFLDEEQLLPDCQPGWTHVIEDHRSQYERRQLRAAVRRDQQPAAEQLEREGWTVTPPRLSNAPRSVLHRLRQALRTP